MSTKNIIITTFVITNVTFTHNSQQQKITTAFYLPTANTNTQAHHKIACLPHLHKKLQRRSVAAAAALTRRRSTPPRLCSLLQDRSPLRRRKRQPRSPCLAASPAELMHNAAAANTVVQDLDTCCIRASCIILQTTHTRTPGPSPSVRSTLSPLAPTRATNNVLKHHTAEENLG